VRKLKILVRMLRNRLVSGDPSLKNALLHRLIFVLNFFPPYNLACWLWVKACVRWGSRSNTARSASWFLLQRGFLFGALRHLGPADRNAFASVFELPVLKTSRPKASIAPRLKGLAEELAATGFVNLGPVLSRDKADAAVKFFRQQQGYASQTPLQSDGVLRPFDLDALEKAQSERYFCFSSKTSLACSQVTELVNNSVLRDVAAAYLGFTPVLYSINTIATTKGGGDHYVMRMHRDYDAFASVTFFVCWTDVSANNGATIFIPRSHLSSNVNETDRTYLTGEAGQVFGVDTFGLHSGNRNVSGLRLATWMRFGSIPNLGTIQDPDLVPEHHEFSQIPLTTAVV
jgi:hypothetical protein